MESSDVPLVVPLHNSVMAMFSETLQELGAMKDEIAQKEKALQQKTAPPSEIGAEDAAAAAAAQSAKKQPAPKAAKGKGGAPPPPQEPTDEELAAEKRKKDDEEKRRKQLEIPDMWLQSVHQVAAKESESAAVLRPHVEWMRERMEFLCAKPSHQYMIEDLLGEWLDEEHQKQPEQCLDIVSMAREHSEKLKNKYGYCAPRGLHEVGKVTPKAEDPAETSLMISTHSPGGAQMSKTLPLHAIPRLRKVLEKIEEEEKVPPVVAFPDAQVQKKFEGHFPEYAQEVCREAGGRVLLNKDAIEGKHVMLIDQSAAKSGAALLDCKKLLYARGAKNVSAFIIDADFAKNSWERFLPENAKPGEKTFSRIFCTDSVPDVAEQLEGKGPFTVFEGTASRLPKQPSPPPLAANTTTKSPPRTLLTTADRISASGSPTKQQKTGPVRAKDIALEKPLEISESALLFENCLPGHTYEKKFKVWNRDTNRRRIKINSVTSKLLSVKPVTAGYDADVPVVPGTPVEFLVTYKPVDAVNFEIVLKIVHARDVQRMNATENQYAQWTSVDLPVTCVALPPELHFDDGNDEFNMDPCFVFATQTRTRTIVNTGCAGHFSFAVDFPFLVEPSEVTLRAAEKAAITLAFSPDNDTLYTTALKYTAKLAGDAAAIPMSQADVVTTAKSFPITARGTFPHVWISGIGTATLAQKNKAMFFSRVVGSDEVAEEPQAEEVPLAMVEDACVDFSSAKTVCINNDSPLPIEYEWRSRHCGDCGITVFPPSGTLPPMRSTIFSVELTPQHVGRIEALFSLFAKGLPKVQQGYAVPCMSRKKPLPQLADALGTEHDPFLLFGDAKFVVPSEESDDLFMCAAKFVADPTELKAHLVPTKITNTVPCLIKQENVREFVIVNECSRNLSFWLDPPQGDEHPGAVLDDAGKARLAKKQKKMKELLGAAYQPPQSAERPGIALQFHPQRGVVPGGGSIAVMMTYSMSDVGHHSIDIECFMPDLAVSPRLSLSSDAIGPNVHLSTDIINFGIIPFRDEAESRVTVTNTSPIPLVFRCKDPQAPPPGSDESLIRYVMLPDVATLKPGQSKEVTVYRRGTSVGDICEKIEFSVDDGQTQFVETRASIQQPMAFVNPSILDFEVVDRAVPARRDLKVTNLSCVDIQYEIIVIDAPTGEDTVTVSLDKPTGVIHAGEKDVPITVEATFFGSVCSTSLLALHSPQLGDPIPFEVTCQKIRQLEVALAVAKGKTEKPIFQPSYDYFYRMIENLVGSALGDLETTTKPYCPAIIIDGASIPDNEPFCLVKAFVNAANVSGCLTRVAAAPKKYPPTEDVKSARLSVSFSTRDLKKANEVAARGDQTTSANKRTKLALSTKVPSYHCKAADGREAQEELAGEILKLAQGMLLDGKGCAIDVKNSTFPLPGHSKDQMQLQIVSNIPGEYTDKLHIMCDGAPDVEIDVKVKVYGKPILVDPFTSGLTTLTSSGVPLLKLPDAVGGMASIKRHIRITSRCPRDLDVVATLVQHGCFFSVKSATQPDGSYATQIIDASEDGDKTVAWVTPSNFVLEALETKEVIIEYAPPPGTSAMWNATLLIKSAIAGTAYNDRFLIDEYYTANMERYPTSRMIQPESLIANTKHEMRGVPKIVCRLPLVERTGVVKDSVVVYPDEEEIMARHGGSLASHPAAQQQEDSDDDEHGGTEEDRQLAARNKEMSAHFALQDAERQELLEYLSTRRQQVAEESAKYLVPVSLDLMASTISPKLSTDPKEVVRFPSCKVGGTCSRTIRLTNNFAAPFDFRLSVTEPFRITHVTFHPHEVAPTEYESKATASSTKPKMGTVGKLTKSIGQAAVVAKQQSTLLGSRVGSFAGRVDPNSDPAAALFLLKPLDALTVEIELSSFEQDKKHQIEGTFSILHVGGQQQTLAMLATVHVPTLVAEPPMTWFRPCVDLADGKPQPRYPRTITLANYSTCAAPFMISHLRADRPLSRGNETLTRLQKMQQTLRVSPLEAHALVMDDPERFNITPMEGIVPAATAGGQPGSVVLTILFDEKGRSQFESKFSVAVEGGVGCEFVVRGDSKAVEL